MSDLCAISHEPLDACAVTAACGHRFNPDPWEEYYNYEVNFGSGYIRIECPICRATLGVVNKGAGMYIRIPPSMIHTKQASSTLWNLLESHPFDGKAYEMMTETLCLDGADEGGPPVTAYAAAAPTDLVDLTGGADSGIPEEIQQLFNASSDSSDTEDDELPEMNEPDYEPHVPDLNDYDFSSGASAASSGASAAAASLGHPFVLETDIDGKYIFDLSGSWRRGHTRTFNRVNPPANAFPVLIQVNLVYRGTPLTIKCLFSSTDTIQTLRDFVYRTMGVPYDKFTLKFHSRELKTHENRSSGRSYSLGDYHISRNDNVVRAHYDYSDVPQGSLRVIIRQASSSARGASSNGRGGASAAAASSSARGASSSARGASSSARGGASAAAASSIGRRRTRETGQNERNVRQRHSSSDEDDDSLTSFSLASALRQNNEYMRNLEYEPGHRYASQTINGKPILGVVHESSDTFNISRLRIYEDRLPLVYRSSDLYKTVQTNSTRRMIATIRNVAMNHVIEQTRNVLTTKYGPEKKWFVVKMPSQNDPTIYVRLITQITQHNDSISWVKKTQTLEKGTRIDAPYHIGAILPLVLRYTEEMMVIVNNPPIQPAPGQTRAEAMQQRVEMIQNDAINHFVNGQENKAIMKRILKGTAGVHLIPIVGWYGFKLQNLSDDEWTEAAELSQGVVTNITEDARSNVINKFASLNSDEAAILEEHEIQKLLSIARARKVIREKRRFKRGRTAPRPVTVVDLNGQQHDIWYFPRFNYKPSLQNGELIIRTLGDLFGHLYTTGARQLGQRSSGAASAAAPSSTGLKLRF